MKETAQAETAGHARYTFRLRVSSTARAALDMEWARCRWVWNECVARSKRAYADGEECGPVRLSSMLTEARSRALWLREGASVPQQQTIRDFAKSRAKALKDFKSGLPQHRRAGMPDGRLCLAGGIVLTVGWSRELPADPSSVRVYQDSLGHWYCSFVVPAQADPLPATGRVLGVDWGVKETATTTSDAHDLPHAEHGKRAAQGLARYQRQMARRRRPKGKAQSKGYRKARAQAAKLQRKVARQREDTARK